MTNQFYTGWQEGRWEISGWKFVTTNIENLYIVFGDFTFNIAFISLIYKILWKYPP